MAVMCNRKKRMSAQTRVSCLLCDGGQFTLDERFPEGGWGLRRCQTCGLIETSPFPAKERRIAENEEKYGDSFLAMQQSHRDRNHRVHKIALAEIAQASKLPGRRLLDVGCGAGQFLRAAIGAGWHAEAVEFNRENARTVAESGMKVFTGTIEEASYPDAAFDVVTLWDILEHIHDPIAFLEETLRILKPGGLVFLQSPNIDSDVASLWGVRWPWLCLPDHLYHFTPDTIRLLFEKPGFLVKRVYTWEPFLTRVKSIANAREGAPKVEKALRAAMGLGPAAVTRLVWANSRRMGLVRGIAYKAES